MSLKIPNYYIFCNAFDNFNSPLTIYVTAVCVKTNLKLVPCNHSSPLNIINATGLSLKIPNEPPIHFSLNILLVVRARMTS